MNVSHAHQMLEYVMGNVTANFERHIREKKRNAERYMHAFRWLTGGDGDGRGNAGVFRYIDRELLCRRLEQALGATYNGQSDKSREAREQVWRSYGDPCPCAEQPALAFNQYN